jgi:hypothetical protein
MVIVMKTLTADPVRKAAKPMPDHAKDWTWINKHLEECRGRWVLVHNGQLIASDASIRQLLNRVPQGSYPHATVTYIPTEEEAQRIVL